MAEGKVTGLEENERTIVITRVFEAPRALVFRVWTDPLHVAQWWGPRGFTATGCTMDLRVGGVFTIELRGPDGRTYPSRGIFREVVEPERIVYAGEADETDPCGAGLPPRSLVTILFAEEGMKTRLTIHTRLDSVADVEAAMAMGFGKGWSDSLDRLAETLAAV